MREAKYWTKEGENKVRCALCPHGCVITAGNKGLCRARANADGALTAEGYGKITSIALDPIEKKPLFRFYPGSSVLSVGSYGCNLRCPFCQNHVISMGMPRTRDCTPEELAEMSLSFDARGNIGVAYTYNEPFIAFEFVYDCARLIHAQGQKNVLVTNGMINREPLNAILPYIDAMNIDVKCFTEKGYKSLGGELAAVKQAVRSAARHCHVEVTSLIVPGLNDGAEEMEELSKWLASISPQIPLHINRYYPRYKSLAPATDISLLKELEGIASAYLEYVRVGNC